MHKLIAKAKREWISLLAKIRLTKVSSDYLGMPLRVPVIHGVFNGGYIVPAELWMGQCLKAFVETKAGAVIDIGVNVGLYLVKLRLVSRDRQYVGFDPNPFCVFFTQELIRLNGFPGAKVLPIALAETDGISRFYAAKVGDKTGSLVDASKDMHAQTYSIDVLTMPGDRAIDLLNPSAIAVIKIDVEEAEIYVLRGLRQSILRYRPYIYCEILHFGDDPARRQRATDIYDLVSSMNYVVLGLQRQSRSLDRIDSVAAIDTRYEQEFIFCPAELHDKFRGAIGQMGL